MLYLQLAEASGALPAYILSILYLRCRRDGKRSTSCCQSRRLSILYLRCVRCVVRRAAATAGAFNSLFEMLEVYARRRRHGEDAFNSLFEMRRRRLGVR